MSSPLAGQVLHFSVESCPEDGRRRISNEIIPTKSNDKQDDFDIVNFPFLDGDVPRATSYVYTYISQLIRFARASSDFYNYLIKN